MDKPISVGDLVVIVKSRECCPERSRFGFIFMVERIETDEFRCTYCKKDHLGLRTIAWGSGKTGADISRLKRIPPLGELENSEWADKLDTRQPA